MFLAQFPYVFVMKLWHILWQRAGCAICFILWSIVHFVVCCKPTYMVVFLLIKFFTMQDANTTKLFNQLRKNHVKYSISVREPQMYS